MSAGQLDGVSNAVENQLTEIRSVLYELKESTGRLRSDVQAVRDTISSRSTRIDDLERSQRKIERWQNFHSGGLAVLGVLIGGIFKLKF